MTLLPLLIALAQTPADLSRLQAAQRLVQEGRGAEAVTPLTELAARFPRSPEIRFFLGSALGQAGRLPEAIEHLRIATALDPRFQPALRVLGMFRVQSGDLLPETRATLERAVELDAADGRARYWLGRFLLETRSPASAKAQFEESLRLQPDSTPARLGYALALEGTGDTDAALTQFEAVLANEPGSAPALLGRARCLYRKQQFEPALESALEARDKGAETQDRRGLLWILSRLYRALGRDKEAEAAERQLAEVEAGFNQKLARFRDLVEQAMQFRREGNRRMVVETLELALKLEERQDALVMLGDTYVELGRLADAERCFVRANQAGPESAAITLRLQHLRARLGK